MLVAVLSVKGSPGVTTFSVALAARWPAPVRSLLIEADPSGGDLATRFSLTGTPGLPSLTAAARRSTDTALAWQHAQALPGGLLVVPAPQDADRARTALAALTSDPSTGTGILRRTAEVPNAVVIVDCGRIDPGSPAMPIVCAADVMVVLTRAHADDLAHLARRVTSMGRWSAHPVLLLVGAGYSTTDVARELGVPPLGLIPEDPRGAAVLCGRPAGLRWRRGGPSHSALGRVAHQVARNLSEHTPRTAAPGPVASNGRPVTPLPRAIPGVPNGPVAAGGVHPPPQPPPPPARQPSLDARDAVSHEGTARS